MTSCRGAVYGSCVELALAQYGAISAAQARDTGMSMSAIQRRVRSGAWIRLYPGVYRLREGPPSWEQSLVGACLWGGRSAVACRRSAARLWELGPQYDVVEIVMTKRSAAPAGMILHHTDLLPSCDIARHRGVPVTTPTRTLIDLGAATGEDVVERALETALRERLTTIWYLVERLDAVAACGRNGVGTIRSVLRARDPRLAPTESELESLLWQVISSSGLPQPSRQLDIYDEEGFLGRCDFVYPEQRLVVEAQGARWHSGNERFLRDMDRRTRLMLAGWKVLEISWQDIVRRPRRVTDRIHAALFKITVEKRP